MDGGKRRQTMTRNQAFAGAPFKWWDVKSKDGVPVQITFREGTVSVSCGAGGGPQPPRGRGWGKGKGRGRDKDKAKDSPEKVEVVSLEGFEKATGGKIRFAFQSMSLCMTDLVIEGKYDPKWAEAQIEKLRKDGKLKLSEPAAAGQKPGSSAGGSKASAKKKKGAGGVDEPDPEGGDDL